MPSWRLRPNSGSQAPVLAGHRRKLLAPFRGAAQWSSLLRRAEGGEAAGADDSEEEQGPLYFGGVAERPEEPEAESESMRIANRINQALRLRRAPPPVERVYETGWYDELGIAPTATMEDLRLRYLESAELIEERLEYLMEEGSKEVQALLDNPDAMEEVDDYDEGEEEEVIDSENLRYEGIEDEDEEEDEEGGKIMLSEEEDFSEAIAMRQAQGIEQQDEKSAIEAEADRTTMEFVRLSNLYQILSAPKLRRIYDTEGVEGLAQRSPQLHKGLLDPAKVLMIARGQKVLDEEKDTSLLLRRFPKTPGFKKYRSKNSIRQVLKRMTDMFRVWCFTSPEQLDKRKDTVYEALPEIGIFGRINSGKSSLIQHMFSAAKPWRYKYASSSQRPGKTKGVDVYCVNRRFTIADMPGWGSLTNRGPKEKEIFYQWKDEKKPIVDKYIETTPWMRAAIYVHDIAKDPTAADRKMVEELRRRDIPVLLVFSKDDKVDSETHRLSRVKFIRRGLRWPTHWPHAHYCARRDSYGQIFKNMLGTMLLGLISTEEREDAMSVLENELPSVFHDYRDKYVPRLKGPRGEKLPKKRRWRMYPQEDKVYTDEELEIEERAAEREEKRRMREEMEAQGITRTLQHDMEEEVGTALLTQKQRRERWRQMLEGANAR